MDRETSITVSITQNPVTMDYSVTFDGAHTGAGTEKDPLRVENYSSYELPQTGGGALLYALGAVLTFFTAAVLLIRKRTGKSHP